jgi:serine/threonine-protein kinase
VNALKGGSSVGRYRIEKLLGAGAMGEVYLAEDPQIDRKLAIKTVRLAGRPQDVEERKRRLLREARAAGRLLHPHVVTLFDAGEAEGLLYLAFELVEGTDLAARLEAGLRPSLREVLRIARQAAEALDYAHGQGIVHRDIKPSNILLDRQGRVKMADFGIAKVAGQSTELTVAGSVMGSPQYLSPEQVRGEELDGRSDIFSLGVVVYELLSGKRPFDGDTITTLVYQILHVEPPPLSELRAVPPRLERLLHRMLAKDRDGRVATAGEVARELAALEAELNEETLSAPAGAGGFEPTRLLPRHTTAASPAAPPPPARGPLPASPETAPSVPPPPPARPARAVAPEVKRPPLWIPVAAALVILGVAAGGWYLFRQLRPALPGPVAQTEPAPRTASPGVTPAVPAAESAPPVTPRTPAQTRPEVKPKDAVPGAPEAVRHHEGTPAPLPPAAAENNRLIRETLERERPAEPAPAGPSDPEPEPAPSPLPARAEPADQSLRTGLQVAFRVTPPDAFVLVDRTVLGRAQEWSGVKGAQTYTFPGPGTYLVKLRKPGMKDYRIAVEASEAGGTSLIAARLQPLPAAEVDASDLPVVRVRRAVAFRVLPPGTAVLVDDQPMGLARRFSGGGPLRGRGEWLELSPGRHRVSLAARGFRRHDLLVEVTATADRDRERIEVVLTPDGSGG